MECIDLCDVEANVNIIGWKTWAYLQAYLVHSKLCSIKNVATKVHMILWSFVVLIWMCDTIELV